MVVEKVMVSFVETTQGQGAMGEEDVVMVEKVSLGGRAARDIALH